MVFFKFLLDDFFSDMLTFITELTRSCHWFEDIYPKGQIK